MKALRFHAAKDLRVENIDRPPSPGRREVVVRNTSAGICGTDLHEYLYGPIFVPNDPHPFSGAKIPLILGHEFAGVVEEVGDDVQTLKVGDRVSVMPLVMPKDQGYFAERGLFFLSDKLAILGLSGAWGGMAESALLPEGSVIKIPDTMTSDEAALVEPTAVAVYACDRGGVRAGSSVLIAGAGPIGILTALAAEAAGATRIFITDFNDLRLSRATEILPTLTTINPSKQSVAEVVRGATEGGVGCDIAIECVGNEGALRDCIAAARPQGVVVQVGLHPSLSAVDWFQVTVKDMDIRGSFAYPTSYWPRVIDLISSGKIPAGKVVTSRVSLDTAVRDGFDKLVVPGNSHLKIMIDLTA